MADIVDAATRSRMMSGIRSKDTSIELAVRRALFANGFRFRLNVKGLPGKPDIVLPKHHAAIFVHGCFWHGHACQLFKLPATRTDFWRQKIDRNRANDVGAVAALLSAGWRVAIVWQCQIEGKKEAWSALVDALAAWIGGADPRFELQK
jgi:DNA mismatch endonuclease (patch repair protein)